MPLLPADPKDRARARWFEEYADTRLGDVFIWGLFYQKIVHPLVWGEPGDQARIDKALGEDIPAALDYLEGELPADGFLFGDIGLADIAVASFFRNGCLCRLQHRRRSLAAHRRIRRAHADPPLHRRPAAVRGRPAQRRHQGPPPGVARRRRSADRDDAWACASRARAYAPLVLVARDPVLEPGPQRPLRRNVARLRHHFGSVGS